MKIGSRLDGRSRDRKDVVLTESDAVFRTIVEAFQKKAGVTIGGKGFGSSGLKANGKLFAMISSRGQFVVKLPRMRAQELVRLGKGKPFDPGHGRLMKEWVSLDSFESSWPELAKEAYEYVRQGVRP